MAVKRKTQRPSTSSPLSAKAREFQIVAEEAKKEKVPPFLLWGIYGAESTYGTNGEYKFGGIDLPHGNTTNLRVAAREAAKALHRLKKQYGSWAKAIEHYSGNSYTIAHPTELASQSASELASESGGDFAVKRTTATGKFVDLETPFGSVPFPGPNLNFNSPFGPLSPLNALPNIGPGIPGVPSLGTTQGTGGVGGITAFPEQVIQGFASFTALATMITDVHFWIRVGEAVAALILIYMGLHSLTGQGPTPSSIAQTAAATKGL